MRYLILPPEISAFEARYLARMNRIAFLFFVAHLPVFILIAALNDTGPVSAALMTLAVLAGPAVALRGGSPRLTSVVLGVAGMFLAGVLVHIGQGPVQIEMHFYFFVLIALLAVFANPVVILAAAATVASHHAILWVYAPTSVFNYDAEVWVVGVHAAFVVLESVAGCFIARSFFDNVVGLERIVADRTAELATRNSDMRMLLDAIEKGFFTVDRHGVMSAERSAAVDRLLGTPPTGVTLPDFLRQHNPKVADWLAVGLEEVFADVLPVEVTLDQLPKRLEFGDRILRMKYTAIPRVGPPEALAVTIIDITVSDRLEREHNALMAMVQHIVRDRAGFLEFVGEAEESLGGLSSDTADGLTEIKRKVHTLKGNAAIFGLDAVAAACHQIEDHIADTNTLPGADAWDVLHAKWAAVRTNLTRLGVNATAGIAVTDAEHADTLLAILAGAPRAELARRVAAWGLEPTRKRLLRLGEHAKQLASRLGKGEVEVRLFDNGLCTEAEQWGFFWSALVHVIRNAIDHGLETPAERVSAGKPSDGTIGLTTRLDGSRFVIAITDDGRGIDWERVATAAAARGLPATSPDDLVDALFSDGLSTAAAVGSTSGRGVGLGAVRAVCKELGGRVSVRSEQRLGTTFEFSFPRVAMAPSTFALLGNYGVQQPEEFFFANSTPSAQTRRAPEPLTVGSDSTA